MSVGNGISDISCLLGRYGKPFPASEAVHEQDLAALLFPRVQNTILY
jgi:hypothetical protein